MARRAVYFNGLLYVLTTLPYYLLRFDKKFNCQHYEFPWKNKTDVTDFVGASSGNLVNSNNGGGSIMIWLFEESNGTWCYG